MSNYKFQDQIAIKDTDIAYKVTVPDEKYFYAPSWYIEDPAFGWEKVEEPFKEGRQETTFAIYRLTNPEGKVYIGKTRNFAKRMNNYMSPNGILQPILKESLVLHGFHAHMCEKLFGGLVKDLASEVETGLIMLYKSRGVSLNSSLGDGSLGIKGSDNKHSIAVVQTDLKGNFIKEHASATEAAEELGKDQTRISLVVRDKTFYAYGFLFGSREDYDSGKMIFIQRLGKNGMIPVVQLTKNGEFIKEWQSGVAADNYLGLSAGTVGDAVRYKWLCADCMWCKKSDFDQGLILVYKKREQGIKIKMTNTETGEETVFSGIKHAIRDLKIDSKTIKRSLNGLPIKRSVSFSYLEEEAKKRTNQ